MISVECVEPALNRRVCDGYKCVSVLHTGLNQDELVGACLFYERITALLQN